MYVDGYMAYNASYNSEDDDEISSSVIFNNIVSHCRLQLHPHLYTPVLSISTCKCSDAVRLTGAISRLSQGQKVLK